MPGVPGAARHEGALRDGTTLDDELARLGAAL